jgi:hypothetical protein
MALSSKLTPIHTARRYANAILPVSVPDSTTHLMLHGVTTHTENATTLATTYIRSTAGAQATSLNSLYT